MKKPTKVWMEEYSCGCTFAAKFKKDLLGYCEKHGHSTTNVNRLPVTEDEEFPLGHAS